MGLEVSGDIALRWAEWNSAAGAFGPAIGPEQDVPGHPGRRQAFRRGEIAVSPEQGLVVSVYRLWNDALFEWSVPAGGADHFRYDVDFRAAGQDAWVPQGFGRYELRVEGQQQLWARLRGFGDYAFTIRACDGDDCSTPTVPVTVHLGQWDESPEPAHLPVPTGPIGERWHEIGAWDGPLGLPLAGEDAIGQPFEHGSVVWAPAFGGAMTVAAYQRHNSVEVAWGGADTAYDVFQIEAYDAGGGLVSRLTTTSREGPLEWARAGTGSGLVVFRDLALQHEGPLRFAVFPAVSDDRLPLGVLPPFTAATPSATVPVTRVPVDAHLPYPPLDDSAAQAFASAGPRAEAVARYYAGTVPLGHRLPQPDEDNGRMTENASVQLLSHLHGIARDPGFRTPRELPSRFLVPIRLRLRRSGPVGTDTNVSKDYDLALKGLMTILYRYRAQLADSDVQYILQDLVPDEIQGGHDEDQEIGLEIPPLVVPGEVDGISIPETENHMLMIDTSRYLVNQVLHDLHPDPRYDNVANGLTGWLLDFLQVIARHDFLEFNARPYQRLSLHALLNLYEFARDEPIRTAAAILLDYTAVKFAVSSSRGRRISPFRRLQERIAFPRGEFDDLTAANGDVVTVMFMMWLGTIDDQRRSVQTYWDGWALVGLLSGTSAYRPPSVAYVLARDASTPAQHVFAHGRRPRFLGSEDDADGGIEIYHRSPSFLLSAGGAFLNSGYGHDAVQYFVKQWAQTARAQAVTLIPAHLDLHFDQLIRFEPWPDEFGATPDADAPIRGRSVNTGVWRGLAVGANLRVPQSWLDRAGAAWEGSWLFLDLTALGFHLAAYRAPALFGGGTDPAGPENLGLFYAMEADATGWGGERMPFGTFRQRILDRNRFPPAFDFGSRDEFATPDAGTYRFWLDPSATTKYVPRITDPAEPPLPFDQRPLVAGPCLTDGGPGHDPHTGYLQARYPQPGTDPLVLDFHDRRAPVRTESSYQQPLVDRARAIIAYAQDIVNRQRGLVPVPPDHPIDPADALRTATEVFRAMDPPDSVRADYLTAWAETAEIRSLWLYGLDLLTEAAGAARDGVVRAEAAGLATGADIARLAPALTRLAGILAGAGATDEGAAAQQATVDLYDRLAPDRYLDRADATATLIERLFDAGRPGEVPGLLPSLLDAYRAHSGAAAGRVAIDLDNLAKRLHGRQLDALAVDAARAAVDVLTGAGAVPGPAGEKALALAHARQDLLARLVDAGRPADAALADRTLEDYQTFLADPDPAELGTVRTDLGELAGILTTAGLTSRADTARHLQESVPRS